MNTPAWTSEDLARNPHVAADKAKRVEEMFAAIAPSYDLNNRLHSMWRDQAWRRAAVRMADVRPTDVVLDVACGTGDLSLAFVRAKPQQVIGIDFTCNMLAVARDKQTQFLQQNGKQPVPLDFYAGDAMRLPIADQSVDVVSIAFGIRNVAVPQQAVAEFYRVLRPGGRLIILEFSLPRNAMLRSMYNFYFKHIMPRTASWIARDRSGAYKYLPCSVNTFIDRETLVEMINQTGLKEIAVRSLTFGIAVVYRGIKQ